MTSVIEGPLYASSDLSAGIQICDIIGSCGYALSCHKRCGDIEGALDYKHAYAWQRNLQDLEFKSENLYDGYVLRGFKYVDQCSGRESSAHQDD